MRGKQGRGAAVRHDAAAATATIEDYRNKVTRLEAENRDLRQRNKEREESTRRTERQLRAERDEGLSPKLEALTLRLRVVTEERDELKRKATRNREQNDALLQRLVDHFKAAGLTPLEATERSFWMMGGEEWANRALSAHVSGGVGEDAKAVVAIQRARGERGPVAKP